jgi:hypothetical protein
VDDLSMFIIALTVMLLATIYIYLLSAVDVIATENIKSDNVLYSRYIIEFPSEILWVTGKSYDLDISESSSFNSSHYGQALLVIQTVDGNIHTVDMTDTSVPDFSQSMIRSNISTFKVNASDDTGGHIITDLVNDSNYEVVLTTANGSLAIIDYRKALMVHNDSIKFSTQTQIVPYIRDLKGESKSLLGVSENGTLLMIEPTINNQNDSSIASKLAFKVIKTNFTNLLTDGQIVVNNIDNNSHNNNSLSNEVFILTDPVDSYPHGALENTLEPTKLLLLEQCHDNNSKKDGAFCLKEMLKLPEDMEVFETIRPVIIEYVNGTKTSKGVALVASSIDVGSAAYIYDDTSSILFSSKPIGQGFRWLLILGSAMVNNNQSMLVLNETPHLSGIVKFIDIINNKTMSIDGFSAHDYGSRNIGMYTIIDADNDGQEDLIIPTLNKKKIAILSIFGNNETVYVNENLVLNDKLTSNIITLDINCDGYEDIIAGDRSGNLYIFTSQVKYKNQDIT